MTKYIPPFLKESKTPNRFSALSETPSTPSTPRTPSTMASLTSGTMASLTKGNKSYSTKFSEQSRLRNSNYVPQKSVNISSEDDFPSLGVKPILPIIPTNDKFIKMAEDWGKKIEIDKEANRTRIINEEKERRRIAKEQLKHNTLPTRRTNKRIIYDTKNRFYDADLKIYKLIVDDSIDEDSFESGPSVDEEDDDINEEEDTEFNVNIVNDRRHYDELY